MNGERDINGSDELRAALRGLIDDEDRAARGEILTGHVERVKAARAALAKAEGERGPVKLAKAEGKRGPVKFSMVRL